MEEHVLQLAAGSLSRGHWWGWQIPIYLFLGGLSAGLMILTAARVLREPEARRSDTFRLLAWLAPLCLSLGMLALWLDLERRWHVPRFYLAFRPKAPMSWGAWILLAVYPLAILYGLGELPRRWKERILPSSAGPEEEEDGEEKGRPAGWRRKLRALSSWAERPAVLRKLAWGNLALGAALGVYTGVLLSAMAARPLWSSAVLGPLFLVSGLSTAAALMMIFRVDEGERRILGRLDAGLIVLELGLLGLFLLNLITGAAAQQAAARLLLGGAYTASFWSLVVAVGLAVPLLAEFWELRGQPGSRWFASALVLVGGLALRWILVSAGQTGVWGMM
jgi:protein NrfD